MFIYAVWWDYTDEKNWTPISNSSKELGGGITGLRNCVWQQKHSLQAVTSTIAMLLLFISNTRLAEGLLTPNSPHKSGSAKKGDNADPHVRQWWQYWSWPIIATLTNPDPCKVLHISSVLQEVRTGCELRSYSSRGFSCPPACWFHNKNQFSSQTEIDVS